MRVRVLFPLSLSSKQAKKQSNNIDVFRERNSKREREREKERLQSPMIQ